MPKNNKPFPRKDVISGVIDARETGDVEFTFDNNMDISSC